MYARTCWQNINNDAIDPIAMTDDTGRWLRVTLSDSSLKELMERFPKLARTEIADVIQHHGPMRETVETELERISSCKR